MESFLRFIGRPCFAWLPWVLLLGCTTGCGGFVAKRIVQAPNSYPGWLAPPAKVKLAFDESLATNLPSRFVEVGPPMARLHYRVLPPADYQLELSSTNLTERGRRVFRFSFDADMPGRTNEFTATPRGTVMLLHGYGLADYAMLPWALCLAQDGWRCVLVELRGHGRSSGKRISFGITETADLSQLLDALGTKEKLAEPVAVVGVSYGASLAMRWKTVDARVGPVVAIAPYAVLSNAVMNICREYSPAMPACFPRAGLKKVPALLGVAPEELDPITVLNRHPVKCLLVTAGTDKVTSAEDMRRLSNALAPGSQVVVVAYASHETVTYAFSDLTPMVRNWLSTESLSDR